MADDFEITEELRQAWESACGDLHDVEIGEIAVLRDFAHDCLAAKLRAEFYGFCGGGHDPVRTRCRCNAIMPNGKLTDVDPRHKNDWAAWQAEATKALEGAKRDT